jgi:hypothetical protein
MKKGGMRLTYKMRRIRADHDPTSGPSVRRYVSVQRYPADGGDSREIRELPQRSRADSYLVCVRNAEMAERNHSLCAQGDAC